VPSAAAIGEFISPPAGCWRDSACFSGIYRVKIKIVTGFFRDILRVPFAGIGGG
jgi:hypothetical protein